MLNGSPVDKVVGVGFVKRTLGYNFRCRRRRSVSLWMRRIQVHRLGLIL
jgi:hypothetical protein